MSPKTLLILLIVIAIVVGVALWRGQRNEGKSNTRKNREDPPGQDFFLFKKLAAGGDPLRIARVVGCSRSGRTLTFSGTCNARIMPGEPAQSSFVLRATAGIVQACYGFTQKQVDDCHDDDSQGDVTFKGKRVVVTKDEAFLRLYCRTTSGSCTVKLDTVTVE